MVIQQGDLYWIELEPPEGSEPGYSHPHVSFKITSSIRAVYTP